MQWPGAALTQNQEAGGDWQMASYTGSTFDNCSSLELNAETVGQA